MAINPATGIEDPNYKPTGLINQQKPEMSIMPVNKPESGGQLTIATSAPTISQGQPEYIGRPAQPIGQPIGQPIVRTPNTETTPVNRSQLEVTSPQTVQGQMADIIAQDSPLQQLATTSALQQANTRGLINSSMAVGAAQDAVIRSALPIAQQDAQTQAAAAQLNVTEANKLGMFGAELSSKDQQFNISEQNKFLMANLDNANKVKLAEINTSYQTLVEQNRGAATLYDTYQRAINAILMNKDLTPESKQQAINMQIGMLQAGMAMYSETSGLNLEAILNFSNTGGGGEEGGGGETPANGVTPISQVGQTGNEQIADLATRQREWDAARNAIGTWDPNEIDTGGSAGRAERLRKAKEAYDKALADLGPRPE